MLLDAGGRPRRVSLLAAGGPRLRRATRDQKVLAGTMTELVLAVFPGKTRTSGGRFYLRGRYDHRQHALPTARDLELRKPTHDCGAAVARRFMEHVRFNDRKDLERGRCVVTATLANNGKEPLKLRSWPVAVGPLGKLKLIDQAGNAASLAPFATLQGGKPRSFTGPDNTFTLKPGARAEVVFLPDGRLDLTSRKDLTGLYLRGSLPFPNTLHDLVVIQ